MTINARLQSTEKSSLAGNSSSKYEEESNMNSPKRIARIAGILYLIVAISAAFPYNVFNGLYIAGDAAATTTNIIAKAGVVRIAVVSDFVMVTAWIFLALTLYRLLKHVHQGAASAMVVFVAIGVGIVSLNNVFEFEGMRVATDSSYAAALGAGGANVLVLMLLDIQRYGGLVSSIFMGLWLVPLGYLAYKSGMFPKVLGMALITVCVCYHAKLLAAFLAPELWTVIQGYVSIPIWIFELWMVLYLLLVGVRTVKPDVRIPAVA